ncbi:hypothetical protein niasHT_030402 [Heterodera trifolii]|uniref:Uncharacterized protein n=1 Tax=Heterodera trifolii TaxID=157864 RepID=A0ABD2JQQ4_9BILA
MGWRFDTSPFRSRLFKWRVSLDEFPFAAFPPYIAAGAVLLTGQNNCRILCRHSARILSHLLAITPQHNANFAFYRQSFAAASLALASSETTITLIAVHDYSPEEMRETYEKAMKQQNQQKLQLF